MVFRWLRNVPARLPLSAGNAFLWPGGIATSCSGSTGADGVPLPIACTASTLFVKAATGATSGTAAVTLYKNGSATAITCALGTGSNATCSDTSHTTSFSQGDTWAVGIATQTSDTVAGARATFLCK